MGKDIDVQENTLQICKNAKTVVAIGHEREIYAWALPEGKLTARQTVTLPAATGSLIKMAVSPDGGRIACLAQYTTLRVANVDTGRTVKQLSSELDQSERCLAMTRDASHLALVEPRGKEHVLRVLDLQSELELFTINYESAPDCVALASNAQLVAAAMGTHIDIHEPRSGKKLTLPELPQGTLSSLAFDGSGRMLASFSSGDGLIRLWDTATGELLAAFQGSQQPAHLLALSPGGRWLATGDTQGHVRLWDLAEVRRQLKEAGLDWQGPPIPVAAPPAPGSAAAVLAEARSHHLAGHYEQALRAYEQALALDAKQPLALRDRAAAHMALHQYALAAADYEKARQLLPDLPFSEQQLTALVERGIGYAEAGQWDKAAADFTEAKKAGADKMLELREYAILLMASGDKALYAKACGRLLDRLGEKESPEVAYPILWTCVVGPGGVSEFARLTEMAEDAVDRHPKEWKYQNTLGAVLYRADRGSSAIDRLDRSVKMNAKEPEPRDMLFLAMAYQKLGHPEEARPWLEKAQQWFARKKTWNADTSWVQRLELLSLKREAENLVK
jgi:tetratricopeptide (TPR) repeat protein